MPPHSYQGPTPPTCATNFPAFVQKLKDMQCHMDRCGTVSRINVLCIVGLCARTVLAAPPPDVDDIVGALWCDDHASPVGWRALGLKIRAWAAHHVALFESKLIPHMSEFGSLWKALEIVANYEASAPADVAKLARAGMALCAPIGSLRVMMVVVRRGALAETAAGERAIRAAEKKWNNDPHTSGPFSSRENDVAWEHYDKCEGFWPHCATVIAAAEAALKTVQAALQAAVPESAPET